jgi:ribosomal protein S18 acetylase RimI-like enzyme
MPASDVEFGANVPVDNEALNRLFQAAWPDYPEQSFAPILSHSLAYVCAYAAKELVGFANVAWDGGAHAFLLDPTVHPDHQRRGIGRELVRRATVLARERGVEWMHVDFEPQLAGFYRQLGFQPTEAGLMRLRTEGG